MLSRQIFLLLLCALSLACRSNKDTTVVSGTLRKGKLLSAFFGLDHKLPRGANFRVCMGAGNEDGMPVIFDREVNVETVQAGDFQVVTKSGKIGSIACVTLAPATDPGELRTALLAGDFGTEQDPPVRVEIVGNILSKNGRFNYKGAVIDVIPLQAGPTLIYAENAERSQWKVGQTASSWGHGTGCPAGTQQALRVVWAGGVKRPDGKEARDEDRLLYRVKLEDGTGIVPFALADLGDGDNNHLLCLDRYTSPQSVFFPAGHLVDPNHDLNPDTEVSVDRLSLPISK